MTHYCKTKNCKESTLDSGGFQQGVCDRCWEIGQDLKRARRFVKWLEKNKDHKSIIARAKLTVVYYKNKLEGK